MLDTELICCIMLHPLQCSIEMPPKLIGDSQSHKSTYCPFTIRRSRVEQNPSHWTIFMFRVERVDALTNAGCGVSAPKRQLTCAMNKEGGVGAHSHLPRPA